MVFSTAVERVKPLCFRCTWTWGEPSSSPEEEESTIQTSNDTLNSDDLYSNGSSRTELRDVFPDRSGALNIFYGAQAWTADGGLEIMGSRTSEAGAQELVQETASGAEQLQANMSNHHSTGRELKNVEKIHTDCKIQADNNIL